MEIPSCDTNKMFKNLIFLTIMFDFLITKFPCEKWWHRFSACAGAG
jgi:hypothetical protein